jgi:hypothetical protein
MELIKKILLFIIDFIKSLLESSDKSQKINQFLQTNNIFGSTEKEKEWARKIVWVESQDLSKMNVDEMIEYRKALTEIAQMGPELAKFRYGVYKILRELPGTILENAMAIVSKIK